MLGFLANGNLSYLVARSDSATELSIKRLSVDERLIPFKDKTAGNPVVPYYGGASLRNKRCIGSWRTKTWRAAAGLADIR